MVQVTAGMVESAETRRTVKLEPLPCKVRSGLGRFNLATHTMKSKIAESVPISVRRRT